MVSDFSFFSTSLGHSSCSHDFSSDFFRCFFSVQLPFTPSHIPACCSEPPPDSSTGLNETCIIFSPGQLALSSAFNIILPCSFKSGEHFWPFPFFLLAKIQKYNLCCDAFSFTIFKSFRLPVQSTRIFIQFSSPHVLIIRFCISFPISLAQT